MSSLVGNLVDRFSHFTGQITARSSLLFLCHKQSYYLIWDGQCVYILCRIDMKHMEIVPATQIIGYPSKRSAASLRYTIIDYKLLIIVEEIGVLK